MGDKPTVAVERRSGEDRRRAGRPILSADGAQSEQRSFRLPPQDMDELFATAQAREEDVSATLRRYVRLGQFAETLLRIPMQHAAGAFSTAALRRATLVVDEREDGGRAQRFREIRGSQLLCIRSQNRITETGDYDRWHRPVGGDD